MKQILTEIQDGTFAAEWILENEIGRPRYRELRDAGKKHPIEDIGKKLRAMMPFVSAGKQKVSEVSGETRTKCSSVSRHRSRENGRTAER